LIIIDNLETFDEKERDRLFQFLWRLPRSCKAIVTSRRRTDVAARIIRLDRLSSEATQKLVAKLAERNKYLARATSEERQILYEITRGNPLLVEWIAGQLGRLESKCRTVADACQYLATAPKDNEPLEYIFGDLLDTFTEHETAVLAALTHFTIPAQTEWITQIADTPMLAAQTALEDLDDRALVISDMKTYFLPPLVATFLRHKQPEIVASVGGRLAERGWVLVHENGGYKNYAKFPVLEAIWPIIVAAIPLLIEKDDNARLQSFCNSLHHFLNFSGRWDERLALALAAEERALIARDFAYSSKWAYIAGRVYYRRGQVKETFACVKRTESHWTVIGAREKANSLRLRGLVCQLLGDYKAAKDAFRKALEVMRALDKEEPGSIAMLLGNLAEAERLIGEQESAQHDYHEALRIARQIDDRPAIPRYTLGLAMSAIDQENWPIAESFAHESLKVAELVGYQEQIASASWILAKALVGQNRSDEGLPYAKSATEILTKLRSPELADARAVLKECGG